MCLPKLKGRVGSLRSRGWITLKLNPSTGKYDKYSDLGYRVERDKYGNLHYFDDENFQVTLLSGGA
jgi:hypothetical protein